MTRGVDVLGRTTVGIPARRNQSIVPVRPSCDALATGRCATKKQGRRFMDKNEFRDRLIDRNLSRRQFSTALASAGLALVTLPVWSRRAAAEGEIEYFTWAQYDNPAFHKAYVEKYGGSPNISFFEIGRAHV